MYGEKICDECGKTFVGRGDVCPACRNAERATDMAVGDNGR